MNIKGLDQVRHGSNSPSDTSGNELGWEEAPSGVDVKQLEVDGSYLSYAERGSGEPVILVHGALGDYRTWTPQLDALSGQYHVISYSRRCHQSNFQVNEENDYTYRRHADDLVALVDRLQLGPVHLVGHSYGGAVAMLFAMEHPEMVSSLILADPCLFSVLSSPKSLISLKFHRIALDVVKRLAENEELGTAVREYVNIFLGKDGFDDLPLETLLVVRQNAQTLQPMLQTFFEQPEFDDYRSHFVKTPTLIITGEFSPSVYRAICVELDSVLSNSKLLTFAGISHGLHVENQGAFNDAVLNFLCRNKTAGKRWND